MMDYRKMEINGAGSVTGGEYDRIEINGSGKMLRKNEWAHP